MPLPEVITIDSAIFAFTSNALITLECDANGNQDSVFNDNIAICGK